MRKPRAMAPRLPTPPISISSHGNLPGCGGPPPVTGGLGWADALVVGLAATQLAGLVMRYRCESDGREQRPEATAAAIDMSQHVSSPRRLPNGNSAVSCDPR
jgi:hypothetical protein